MTDHKPALRTPPAVEPDEGLVARVTPELLTISAKQMASLLRIGAKYSRPRARDWDTTDFDTDAAFLVAAINAYAQTPSIRAQALDEAAKVADEAEAMRIALFSENEASINAHKAVQAHDIAASIRALKGGQGV